MDKYIPIAGGMAGGSADAAAALVACNRLWELGLNLEQLCQIGRGLGADVPACIMGGMSVGEGRGDVLTPLLGSDASTWPHHHWVMVRAHRGLSTPEVFKTLDALRETENNATGIEPAPLSHEDQSALLGDATRVAPVLSNDLTAPALHLYPELAETIRDARAAGACAAILSGSGPTIAVLARDKNHSDELAEALARSPEVSATLPTSGPALGAIVEEEEC